MFDTEEDNADRTIHAYPKTAVSGTKITQIPNAV